MNDINEWDDALLEASAYATPIQMRRLFANIILFTEIMDPEATWEKFEEHLLDRRKQSVQQRRAAALAHVDSILKMHGLSLKNIGLFRDIQFEKARDFVNDNARIEVNPVEAKDIVDEMYHIPK